MSNINMKAEANSSSLKSSGIPPRPPKPMVKVEQVVKSVWPCPCKCSSSFSKATAVASPLSPWVLNAQLGEGLVHKQYAFTATIEEAKAGFKAFKKMVGNKKLKLPAMAMPPCKNCKFTRLGHNEPIVAQAVGSVGTRRVPDGGENACGLLLLVTEPACYKDRKAFDRNIPFAATSSSKGFAGGI